jgi:hypothetical protein
MNGFVDECRREWRRLGVPSDVANEMAEELGADLQEGTPEEVLVGDAGDARSFARDWAAERGVIPRRRRSRLPAALAVLALIPTVIGTVLLLTDDTSESASTPALGFTMLVVPNPDQLPRRVILKAPAPDPSMPPALPISVRTDLVTERLRVVARDEDSNTVGSVLLIAGLAVLVPLTLLWSGRVALNR